MSRMFQVYLCALTFFTGAVMANASALRKVSSLLPLVPDNAQIISGISDPGKQFSTGRLLFVTENNNRDFDDCLALLGIDQNKSIVEVIEAAASSIHGDLTDHLLLLAGRFNNKQIFAAAIENGAATAKYNGQDILVVNPFQREGHRIREVRWMAILNNKFLMFGVPSMVGNSLDRYQLGVPSNPIVLERLERLPYGDNSWTVIAMPPSILAAHLDPGATASIGTQLKGVDEVELGVDCARTARIDFSIHTRTPDFGVGPSSNLQPVLARFSRQTHGRFRIEDTDRVSGSMLVREKEFGQTLAALLEGILRSQDPQTGNR